MKLFNTKNILIVVLALGFSACESFVGGDINQDPNNPTSVPVTAQTPAIQIALADVYGGAFSRFNGALTQQVEGVARQWAPFHSYNGLTPNRFDAAWQNIYENILNEIKIAKATTSKEGYNHYLGIMEIMEAFTIMIATDVWDDMPYTEALQGIENINPTYDTQASIYEAAHALLDNGVSLLSGSPGALVPGSEEVFYGGNVDAWLKVAKAIRARAYLHWGDYEKARAEAEASFTSAADNMGFQYPDANAAGQWYRFNRDRTGDIEFGTTMRAIMTDLQDTSRVAVMDQIFTTDHTYLVADFFQELITYREMQFIIAEADVRTTNGGTQAGYDAYLAGIKASFERLGLGDAEYDTYVAQPEIGVGAGNLTLENVMMQKYIAMWLQPEVYSDFRRTNIPDLVPVSGTSVPVRWHYSSTEYLFNTSAPSETEINIFSDRVGWNR